MVDIKVECAPCDEDDFLCLQGDDFISPFVLCEKCGENVPEDHACTAVIIPPPEEEPVRQQPVKRKNEGSLNRPAINAA